MNCPRGNKLMHNTETLILLNLGVYRELNNIPYRNSLRLGMGSFQFFIKHDIDRFVSDNV